MTAHQMQTVHDTEHRLIRAECSCGEWSGIRDSDGKAGSLTRQHIEHQRTTVATEIDLRKDTAVAWYVRTGHCGACGQPGTYCLCTRPCACSELHVVGSGLAAGALEQFAETAVSTEQGELFG